MSDLWRVVFLLTAGGIIGGLLYWTSTYISSVNLPIGDPSNRWKPTPLFCAANAFMGVGGAWAVLLAMFWARRVPLGRDPSALLELLAISIVAGYAGNRVLPAVAAGLTQQLLDSATATALSAARSANRSRVLTEALAYLVPGAPQSEQQTSHIITALNAELQQAPASAETAILLARTLAECKNDSTGAIHALTSFASRGAADVQPEADPALGALWNLALYLESQFHEAHQPEARQNAISALSELIRLAPSYRTRVLQEPAFADLRNDPSARQLL